MQNRKERRAVEHAARKAARKAGFPITQPSLLATAIESFEAPDKTCTLTGVIPEPGAPFPSLASISPAQLTANRANSQLSTGPLSPATKAISAQNHTLHGLARHQTGAFQLIISEDSKVYEAFKQSLFDEHEPSTPTETLLVTAMAESHWLSERAQRLQFNCLDPISGEIADEKKFSLYQRYQTTHTRTFHRALNDLLKLRAAKRKAEIGFEAQRIKNEAHEMKKQVQYWTVLHKDAQTCHQISLNTLQNLRAEAEIPGFHTHYAAEMAAAAAK
jgi:hypothetical protein